MVRLHGARGVVARVAGDARAATASATMGAAVAAALAVWVPVLPLPASAAAPAGPARAGVPAATRLPTAMLAALQRAAIPADAVAVALHDAATGHRLLHWRADQPMNPASLAKLVTTTAALERLGPAYTWTTPVWVSGPVGADGVLDGNVYIRGSGDPKLVVERVWLLLRRLQNEGVREIRGDIVLDGGAFAVPDRAPGDFDGEPLRPHNVQPAALLLNFRSVVYAFVPDAAAGVARVRAEPALAGTAFDRAVPLAAGPCGDWRAALQASFEPGRARFAGSYPAACGELAWPVADPQPATYDGRLLSTLWHEMGGRLHGSVRAGSAPLERKPTFEMQSPALAELVRDVNKYSSNVMAQQIWLTLALQAAPAGTPATPAAARELMLLWLADRTGPVAAPPAGDVALDSGSGLSRGSRIGAARLARLLLHAWTSPFMSELMSSLPVSGVDGTLRRSRAEPGRAHLKTGSLRDAAGLAGYVLGRSGRRYVLVAIVNHPQAAAARPALDALVQWVVGDAGPP